MKASIDLGDDVVDIYEETPQQTFTRRQQYAGASNIARNRHAPFSRLLLWCAGVDVDVLRMCPHELPKYVALGGSVAVASVLSGVSLGLALELATGVPLLLTLAAALFWSLANLNLDRWLMASDVAGSWGGRSAARTLARLAPRFALSILLATVVTEPIVLSIFRPEVDYQLQADLTAQLDNKTSAIDRQIAAVDAQRSKLQAELFAELSGTGGSGLPGNGARASALRDAINGLLASRRTLEGDRRLVRSSAARPQGILARMEALDRLSSTSPSITAAIFAVRLFLVMIFLTPGLLAFSNALRKDTYHALLEIRVREIVATARAQLKMAELRANRIHQDE